MNEVMASLGRLLGTLGWLWFIAGIAAPIFDVGGISFIPGLILVFVGRLLRSQARRRQPGEEEPEPVAAEPAPRPLNTERVTLPSVPPTPPPPVESEPRHPATKARADAEQEADSEELFSKALFAASAHIEERTEEAVTEGEVERKALTSDEMIARARQRWDRRG